MYASRFRSSCRKRRCVSQGTYVVVALDAPCKRRIVRLKQLAEPGLGRGRYQRRLLVFLGLEAFASLVQRRRRKKVGTERFEHMDEDADIGMVAVGRQLR